MTTWDEIVSAALLGTEWALVAVFATAAALAAGRIPLVRIRCDVRPASGGFLSFSFRISQASWWAGNTRTKALPATGPRW